MRRSYGFSLLRDGTFEVVGIYGRGQTLTSPTLGGFTIDIDDNVG